jgi:hypothetical protein
MMGFNRFWRAQGVPGRVFLATRPLVASQKYWRIILEGRGIQKSRYEPSATAGRCWFAASKAENGRRARIPASDEAKKSVTNPFRQLDLVSLRAARTTKLGKQKRSKR